MEKGKQLEIYQDEKHLGITLNWYSPKSLFLVFFALIWNLFLLFFYSGLFIGGADLLSFLFPSIHLVVGLFLAYSAAAKLFNKTYLDIHDDHLHIEHKPLPWWKGKKKIPIDSITQIYVKEKITRNKNRTHRYYTLRALIKDGFDMELLNIGDLSSEKAKEIENQIEAFLSISDEAVKGEFGTDNALHRIARKRPLKMDFADKAINFLYHSEEKDIINIKEEALAIISVSQYDWNDGESDKLLQLIDENGQERLLHVEQNKALLQAYSEKEISLSQTGFVHFDINRPIPLTLIDGEQFSFKQQKTGLSFNSSTHGNVNIQQWIYENPTKDKTLRAVNNEGQISFYLGQKTNSKDFSNTLDLEERNPEKEIDYRDNYLDEDELI